MEPDISKMNPGQQEVHRIITEVFKSDYFSHLSMLAQMMEEVGEVARAVNRLYGEQNKKDGENLDLEGELGDVMFTLCCIANKSGINLDEALKKTLLEKGLRDKERYTEEAG